MRRAFVLLLSMGLVVGMAVQAGAAPKPETVTVAGPYIFDEAVAFEDELSAFTPGNRVDVVYEGYEDLLAVLPDLIASDDPPDVIITPFSGPLNDLESDLVDLGKFVNPKSLHRDFGDHLISTASSSDGAILGVPIKADLKSLVWYKPTAFAAAGYDLPETFDELVALTDRIVADGRTPWCNYIESGSATGWMGTDWVEDLLLSTDGPDVYDGWVDHSVVFQDQRVETAFERFLLMQDRTAYVFDRANMLNVFFFENAIPLDAEDCLMHKQGSFFDFAFDIFGLDPGEFASFKFPAVDATYEDSAIGGASFVAALNDRREVRQLVRFMASQRFGRAALAEYGWILPNVRFDTDRYSDDAVRSWAEIVQAAIRADLFREDGSDAMPPEVGQGSFWAGIRDLVAGTKTIPQVLEDIDASWP